MTLTEFLLARIAEDEASIDDMVRHGDHGWWSADRMLDECEAKRRIVHDLIDATGDDRWPLSGAARYLAAVYADHPDYRDEWRP